MVCLFRSSIKPVREDEQNLYGGKWVISCADPEQLRAAWFELILAVVGGYLPRPELVVSAFLLSFVARDSFRVFSCYFMFFFVSMHSVDVYWRRGDGSEKFKFGSGRVHTVHQKNARPR